MKFRRVFATILVCAALAGEAVYAQEGIEDVNYMEESEEADISATDKAAEAVKIDEVHFPDAVFREYVSQEFDLDQNNELSAEELNAVSYINVVRKGIADLSGIEYFSNLNMLYCGKNKLRNLDISKNIKLDSLECGDNQLEDLDISQNANLRVLYCWNNQLTVLNLSENPRLRELSCFDNQLTELNFNPNTNLDTLYCGNNLLTALDLRQHSDLRQLDCSDNELGNLDISDKSKLASLNCSNIGINELDISHNPLLYALFCADNSLQDLDISNHSELLFLWCGNNQLTSLDVSQNERLKVLWCSDNQLADLDVRGNRELVTLICEGNQLKNLDTNNNPKLESLLCGNNQLTTLDVHSNSGLKVLSCHDNQLSGIDTSSCRLQSQSKVTLHGKEDMEAETHLSPQFVSASAYQQDGKWMVDLSKSVQADKLASISVKEGTYDTMTGVWTLPENASGAFVYTIFAGTQTNESAVEENLNMDIILNVIYTFGNSAVTAETDPTQVRVNFNEIDVDSICDGFQVNSKTAKTKILLKQSDANSENVEHFTKIIDKDGNTALNAYGIDMRLYVDEKEKGAITGDFGRLTLNLYAGTEHKGKKVIVYQRHGEEDITYKDLTVDDNGMVSITVNRLSTFVTALQENKVVKGDINGDKQVNLLDLMLCLNHVSKKNLLTGDAFTGADIDSDGIVNLLDLMRILNYVSKKSEKL